jgi:hypothetical protein
MEDQRFDVDGWILHLANVLGERESMTLSQSIAAKVEHFVLDLGKERVRVD